jgi:2-polyprenyl-3-methyl-5-hydroxy-6-metoxy-1,4-benzoquinol methylase
MSRKKPGRENDGQLKTLDNLSKAFNYNEWIFNLTKPHLGKRILEVGCGVGNMTLYLTDRIVLGADIDSDYLNIARKRFKGKRNINFHLIDLEKGLKYFKKFKPDTIVCINVLEHIRRDEKFISECESLLSPGGKLILFIPAMPSIYGQMDKTYGHFRRYTKIEILRKVHKKLNVVKCEYLNIFGVLGWWYNGRLLKMKTIPGTQLLVYDKFFKFFMLLEKKIPKFFGLSLFVVGQK